MPHRRHDTTSAASAPLAVAFAVLVAIGCGDDTDSDASTDTTPPEVVATVPETDGVWTLGSPILLSFSEPVTSQSVATGVRFTQDLGIRVEYDATTLTATVTVLAELEVGAWYTLVVRSVEDLSGNKMADVQEVTFTVAAD